MTTLLGGDAIARLLSPSAAADALVRALADGLDPEAGTPRTATPVPAGELLAMPAAWRAWAGVKIVGVAPGNPARGLARITGGYLLFDGPTLRPLALLDGAALTALRTPAVTAVAIRALAVPDAGVAVVFGSGPQAYGHLAAALAERPVERVHVVARDRARAERLARHAGGLGVEAGVSGPDAVAGADLVLCCTSAREPLFDGRLVPGRALVAAVGSHTPDAREVDTALVRRSEVHVEARSAALREAGDLLIPMGEGAVGEDCVAGTLAGLADRPPASSYDRPRLFKSVGMAWEDLVLAAAVHRAATDARGTGET
ncbi:ornithine cyclodeaminase family protein [Streptomyces sp. MUM 178J]|uniref:ornithine cyclodeaminase family protein n=1 Tax=Streptomyces sp. MUM 178J TaxID=2791991 RepID=UPI001F041B50|nr:ornithine cyclodeaminase family protein [Streptomyces sp. MUM 178J]WRQ80667.1 ornithine cyclodeaminase family protein [Streptomyces sp. MUM 178J]